MNVKNIKAIDFHSHFNHGHPSDSGENELYRCDLDFVLKMNEAANVEKTICSTLSLIHI